MREAATVAAEEPVEAAREAEAREEEDREEEAQAEEAAPVVAWRQS
jgi:hypothetical protein